jgi:hypothetical protein
MSSLPTVKADLEAASVKRSKTVAGAELFAAGISLPAGPLSEGMATYGLNYCMSMVVLDV